MSARSEPSSTPGPGGLASGKGADRLLVFLAMAVVFTLWRHHEEMCGPEDGVRDQVSGRRCREDVLSAGALARPASRRRPSAHGARTPGLPVSGNSAARALRLDSASQWLREPQSAVSPPSQVLQSPQRAERSQVISVCARRRRRHPAAPPSGGTGHQHSAPPPAPPPAPPAPPAPLP